MLQLPAFWLFLTIASALEINWSFKGNRRLQSSQLKKWRRMAALSGYTKKTRFRQRWHTRCAVQNNQDSDPCSSAFYYYLLYFPPSFKGPGACGQKGPFAATLLSHHVIVQWQILLFVSFLPRSHVQKPSNSSPSFRTRRLIEKICVSFLIYAFLKKSEQASILEMSLSAQ